VKDAQGERDGVVVMCGLWWQCSKAWGLGVGQPCTEISKPLQLQYHAQWHGIPAADT
jgi:hypothetical protein